MFKDYFIEADIDLSAGMSSQTREHLRSYGLSIDCTPGIKLDDNIYLNYCRIGDTRREDTNFNSRAHDAITPLGWTIVANSFEELWEEYDRAADYFVVDIEAGSTQKRIPLSGLKSHHHIVDNLVHAPGIFMGGPEFQTQLTHEKSRPAITSKLNGLIELVRTANDLSEEERRDILGYLEAAHAILGQANPDKRAFRVLLERLGKRIGVFTARLGERYVTNELIDFIKEMLSDSLPF